VTTLGLGFVLVGALRALRAWGWRLEQVEFALAGRLGLPPGTKAPPFSLRSVCGAKVTLGGLTGHRLLLVFSHSSGHPCRQLLGELNRLHRHWNLRVLLVETGGRQTAKELAGEGQTAFPVLVQEARNLARRYHVPTMPFAFLIDERGVIRARGTVSNPQHLDLLLGAGRKEPAATVALVRSALGAFVPRPDDVFIVTYPRSGTTWVQMILYQLTTDGKMDFPHITTVCPWFERTLKDGTAYDALPAPRVFKSHLSYRKIPKGPCKYIYVARDGKDVAVSYFHFYTTHMGFKGSFDEFFERFLKGEVQYGSWFRHVHRWWERRDDPNVLFLYYEELAADLPACLRRIAAFCGLEIAPERWPGILERCSFAFMKQHQSQFDPLQAMLYEQGFQPHAFLRQGQAGAWRAQLSPRQARRFDRTFTKRLGDTGLDFAVAAPSSGGPVPCCASTIPSERGAGPSR
jgi:peroxiredoxin